MAIRSSHFALLVAVGLLLRSPNEARAIDPDRSLSEYSVDVWRAREGLPGAWIRALAQTLDGYLWIGTQGGLARYGGGPITTFPADAGVGDVMGLHASRDGTLWVIPARDQPICARDGFRPCMPGALPLPLSTTDDRIIELADDDAGAVWIATADGVMRFANGRLDQVKARSSYDGASLTGVHHDGQGRLWVGTTRGLFVGKDNEGPTAPMTRFALPDGVTVTTPVAGFFARPKRPLWIATERSLLRITESSAELLGPEQGLPSAQLTSVLEDRDGNVWLGSRSGLIRYQPARGATPATFVRFTRADGLPDDDVSAVLEDREGSLWVGTRTGGLAQFNDRTLDRKAGPPSLMEQWVSTVAVDDEGVLWAGSARGLTRFAAGQERTFTTADGLPSNQIFTLTPGRRGELWVGTDRGLVRRRGGRIEPVPGLDVPISALNHEPDGSLWVGAGDVIARIPDGDIDHIERFSIDPSQFVLDRGEMRSIVRDDQGAMWLSANGRLFMMAKGDRQFRREIDPSIVVGKVRSMTRDAEGTLWVGSGDGLARRRAGVWRIYGLGEGLHHRDLYQVVSDDLGYLWIGANHGVLRLRKSSIDELERGQRRVIDMVSFEILDQRREVRVTRTRQPAVWKSRDGRLHFATGRGVVSIDPARVPVNNFPPPVFIERAIVDGRAAHHGDKNEFPPGSGAMEFHFAAITLLEPGKAQHRYRLEGYDADWVDAGTRRAAYYTNMKPGHYRFRVQGSNADGVWNERGDTLELSIAPHFYQTYWFFAAIGLGAIALVLSFHRLRLERLRGRYVATATERARVARELHDSLLQGMAATLMHLRGLRKRFARDTEPTPTDLVATELKTIEELVASNIEETRQFVWDLRDRTTEERELGPALGELVERVAGSNVTARVEIEGAPVPVPRHAQRELMRIAHEAVVNARSHAGAREILVRLRYDDGNLTLSVQDDGHGFDPQVAAGPKTGRFGLTGMRERAAMLGRFILESRPDAGTKVEVNVNLKDLRDV